MKLINIGFGNMVASSRLIAIVSPESAPVKRTVQEARDRGMVVDGTYGRRPVRRVRAKRTAYSIISSRKRTLRRRSPPMRSSSTRSTLITTTARWRLR